MSGSSNVLQGYVHIIDSFIYRENVGAQTMFGLFYQNSFARNEKYMMAEKDFQVLMTINDLRIKLTEQIPNWD